MATLEIGHNYFHYMVLVRQWGRQLEWSRARIEDVLEEMRFLAGDYDGLLTIFRREFALVITEEVDIRRRSDDDEDDDDL